MRAMGAPGGGSGPGVAVASQEPSHQTSQLRRFKAVNQTDSRQGIEDDEFFWLENAMTTGFGQVRITPAQSANIGSYAGGIFSVWGLVLGVTPFIYAVGNDGSIQQFTTAGVRTQVAAPGTVTTAARLVIWQSSAVLIIDANGYFSWDGAVFTSRGGVTSAPANGVAIAVFQGRVWIVTGTNNRTIAFSAPGSLSDFQGASAGGSTVITDSNFQGPITQLNSSLEQLWIVGQGAVNAISNVTVSGVTTSFSNTNVVANIGSNAPGSVIGYFRSLAFVSPFGVYALVGVTPQKLSDKLDGLFPLLSTVSSDNPAAVAVIYNLLVLVILVTYADPVLGNRPMLLCFTQGKWFFASPAMATSGWTWITSLLNAGNPQAWGTDGTNIFRLFVAGSTSTVKYKIQSKLYDFGLGTTSKEAFKLGLEITAPVSISPTVTVDTEAVSSTVAFNFTNILQWINNSAQLITFLGLGNQPIVWISTGLVLAKQSVQAFGFYLGWTITGTDTPWTLQAVQMEYALRREWDLKT